MRRVTKKKINKKKGGEPSFLASGTYGCVYKPSIKCDICTDKICKKDSNVVSKYMNNTHAIKELKTFNNLHLNNINSEHKYHIGKPYKCNPTPNFKPNPYECDVDIQNPSILLYEDGGKDLDNYLKKPCLPYDFFNKMEKLLEFILMMLKSRIAHCDIKNGNIVSGVNGNNFRFIDFGMGINFDNRFIYDTIFSQAYEFWTPSCIFLSGRPENISNKQIIKYSRSFYKKKEYNKFLNTYIKKYIPDVISLARILINVREKVKLKTIFKILKIIDLYSFTTVLDSYVYYHISKFFPIYSHKLNILFTFFLDKTQIYNPNPFKVCSENDFYEYFKEFKKSIKELNIKYDNI